MSESIKLTKEEREQRRLRRLHTASPACACCGETDSRCLERDHIAGVSNDARTTVILCRNCHRKRTDEQRDHPANALPDETLKRIAHFLIGLAELLALIVDKLREFAATLFVYEAPPASERSE